jgi:hypothetical protein
VGLPGKGIRNINGIVALTMKVRLQWQIPAGLTVPRSPSSPVGQPLPREPLLSQHHFRTAAMVRYLLARRECTAPDPSHDGNYRLGRKKRVSRGPAPLIKQCHWLFKQGIPNLGWDHDRFEVPCPTGIRYTSTVSNFGARGDSTRRRRGAFGDAASTLCSGRDARQVADGILYPGHNWNCDWWVLPPCA